VREPRDAFHLAIPARDLDEAQEFYSELGCKIARRYDDRVTIDFFGDQIVCHLSDEYEREPTLYPRHFGVTFAHIEDFQALCRLVDLRKIPVFRAVASRFEGLAEEHLTVVLRDPSNNLIEFKHYVDSRLLY
jgi:extradiol dioxygenase family protein